MREKKATRGLGGKRCNRVNTSLSNRDLFKLNRLATSCNMKPTTLASDIIHWALNNLDYVVKIQQEHCLYSAYKIIPIKDYNHEGELIYNLEENRRDDF